MSDTASTRPHHLTSALRVYIAGPIAGIPDQNRPAFANMQHLIAETGHTSVNPHDVDHSHNGRCTGPEVPRDRSDGVWHPNNKPEVDPVHRYGCYMKADIRALLECDAAVFLAGWVFSKGAKVEREIAVICGIHIIDAEVQDVKAQLRHLRETRILQAQRDSRDRHPSTGKYAGRGA